MYSKGFTFLARVAICSGCVPQGCPIPAVACYACLASSTWQLSRMTPCQNMRNACGDLRDWWNMPSSSRALVHLVPNIPATSLKLGALSAGAGTESHAPSASPTTRFRKWHELCPGMQRTPRILTFRSFRLHSPASPHSSTHVACSLSALSRLPEGAIS